MFNMTVALKAGLPIADDMGRHAESAANLLKALANPHRVQILCVLGEGEFSVGALNRVMPGPALDVIRVLHGHFCSATRSRRK
jgi:hypothetical protein